MPQINIKASLEIFEELRKPLKLHISAAIFEKADNDQQSVEFIPIKKDNFQHLLHFFFPPEDRFAYFRTNLVDDINQASQTSQALADNLNVAYACLLQSMDSAWSTYLEHIRSAFEHTLRHQQSSGRENWELDWDAIHQEYVATLNDFFESIDSVKAFWNTQSQLAEIPCSVPENIADDWLHSIVALVFICLAMLPSGSDNPVGNQQQFALALADEIRKRFCPDVPPVLQAENAPAAQPEDPPDNWTEIGRRQDRDDYAIIDLFLNTKMQLCVEDLENNYKNHQELLLVESIEYAPATNVYDFLNTNHRDVAKENNRSRSIIHR